jgi:hypothetical protein
MLIGDLTQKVNNLADANVEQSGSKDKIVLDNYEPNAL